MTSSFPTRSKVNVTSNPVAPPNLAALGGTTLSVEVFREICAGPVGTAAMGALRDAENAKRKQLLLAFARRMRDGPGGAFPTDFTEAWELLLRVEDEAPETVDEIVMFPTVGLWLERAVDKILDEFPDTPANRAEIGVVHAVAAAAAVRAGLDCAIRVPVAHGVVSLPTVGQFDVPVADTVDFVLLAVTGSRLTLSHAGTTLATRDGTAFRAARRHRSAAAGVELTVVFDDADPHRAFTDATAMPDPLGDAEFARWCAQLDDAWSILVDWHPGYAGELTEGLLSLVPLTQEGQLVGASSAAAFGAIAMCEKPSADDLADALVHELQHSKLNAVFELVCLHEPDEQRHFYAPWRDDPRPLAGVLHGVYAFASVVEFWRSRRRLVPADHADKADFAFVLRALQLRSVITDLTATARLNEWGREFLALLSDRLAACEADLTPADRSGPVADLVADHRAFWRLRHVEPDADDITALADAWLAGDPVPVQGVRHEVTHCHVPGTSDRAEPLRTRALDPSAAPTPVDEADLAYLTGDLDQAARAYLKRLDADPADDQAWAGLALSLDDEVLRQTPEVVRALHHELSARTGSHPDPLRLCGWLAG